MISGRLQPSAMLLSQCHNCRLLPSGGSAKDFSTRIWQKKLQMLSDETIYFVACSRWLELEAKRSALLKGQKITNIPNPIDTHIYKRGDKQEARKRLGLPLDKKLILFASQRVTNENKGMSYLMEACRLLTLPSVDRYSPIGRGYPWRACRRSCNPTAVGGFSFGLCE